jgi:nickel-dependent lactate racemase
MNGSGHTDRLLSEEEVRSICGDALAAIPMDGRRILFVIPDSTRSCPMDQMFRLIYEAVQSRVNRVDFMIALGTHPPMSDEEINRRVGITSEERNALFPKANFENHHWDDPEHLTTVGTFSEADIDELTDGLFSLSIPVKVNRVVREYDHLVIVGPVFPHEVIGFSGGNKYIFPGISGPEVLHFFHWLAAVITNPKIIGKKWTPVRHVVDRAAALLPLERHALCMVVRDGGLAGLYAGTPEEAWSAAADLSREIHIEWKERSYHTVLSRMPAMYDDIWVGGKGMYKLEPVVEDGGRLIIYAPHIKDVSHTHGRTMQEIGYHVRDYFLKQWDSFKHHPWGVIAHSTHVKGIGSFEDGVEKPRIEVELATAIPPDMCKRINLGYRNPADVNIEDFQDRESEGVLFVPRAGEQLFRWKGAPSELGGD